MSYLLTFLAAVSLDIFYVKWMTSVTAERKLQAVVCSVAIGGCSLLGLTAVVTDGWQAVPYLGGLAFGTWVGMWRKREATG